MKVLLIVAVLFVASVVAEREASVCEKHRQRVLENPRPGSMLPKCEENGDYAALQCSHDRYCQCWARDGTIISKPSAAIKNCDCVRERAEKIAAIKGPDGLIIVGAFIPTCGEDGYYHSRQCWGSTGMCWCADKLGNKLTEPTRGSELNC